MQHCDAKPSPSCETNGFTRLELLAALVITTLLATVTISVVQTMAIRDQVRRALEDAQPVQQSVARHILELGVAPEDRAAAGLEPESAETVSEFLHAARVVHGRIDLIFGNHAHQRIAMSRLTLTPYLDGDGGLSWRCGDGPEPPGRPVGAPAGQPGSDIPAYYLPGPCQPGG